MNKNNNSIEKQYQTAISMGEVAEYGVDLARADEFLLHVGNGALRGDYALERAEVHGLQVASILNAMNKFSHFEAREGAEMKSIAERILSRLDAVIAILMGAGD